tara:strand:+ start:28133 stop:28429 length:297 start_codon:yes stop_codon:yes gene_type:complete
MEKLNEVKETYAKELGYKDWETCINDQPNYKVETLMDEVALRLYGVVRSLPSKDVEFIYSLLPKWTKEAPKGLDPTMYGTLTYEGDKEIVDRLKEILK